MHISILHGISGKIDHSVKHHKNQQSYLEVNKFFLSHFNTKVQIQM
jgi:hypothetical protein